MTEDLPAGEYFYIDMGTVARFVICRDMYFKTKADAELFLDRMDTLNANGMTLEIQTNSAAVPGSLLNFISGKTAMEVACLQITPFTKVAYGDGTVYKVGMCKFRQIDAFV